MSEVGRGLYQFPAGIRTPRGPKTPQKCKVLQKKMKKKIGREEISIVNQLFFITLPHCYA